MKKEDELHPLTLNILLADDDKDDCMLFQEALEELKLCVNVTTVHNGEQLMQLLQKNSSEIPDILFLDLNMPRKNGFTCLEEIKRDEKLKLLPVIIHSTLFDENVADLLYKDGAHHYICKPNDFPSLKKVIHQALTLTAEERNSQPPRNKFVLRSLKEMAH